VINNHRKEFNVLLRSFAYKHKQIQSKTVFCLAVGSSQLIGAQLSELFAPQTISCTIDSLLKKNQDTEAFIGRIFPFTVTAV
jgi:hypothetical protein